MKTQNVDDDIIVVAGDNLFSDKLADFGKFVAEKNAPVLAVYDVGNLEEINAAKDKLMLSSNKLAEAMYRQATPPSGDGASAGPGPETGAPGGDKKDNVVDAEFVDVDDKK